MSILAFFAGVVVGAIFHAVVSPWIAKGWAYIKADGAAFEAATLAQAEQVAAKSVGTAVPTTHT